MRRDRERKLAASKPSSTDQGTKATDAPASNNERCAAETTENIGSTHEAAVLDEQILQREALGAASSVARSSRQAGSNGREPKDVDNEAGPSSRSKAVADVPSSQKAHIDPRETVKINGQKRKKAPSSSKIIGQEQGKEQMAVVPKPSSKADALRNCASTSGAAQSQLLSGKSSGQLEVDQVTEGQALSDMLIEVTEKGELSMERPKKPMLSFQREKLEEILSCPISQVILPAESETRNALVNLLP